MYIYVCSVKLYLNETMLYCTYIIFFRIRAIFVFFRKSIYDSRSAKNKFQMFYDNIELLNYKITIFP